MPQSRTIYHVNLRGTIPGRQRTASYLSPHIVKAISARSGGQLDNTQPTGLLNALDPGHLNKSHNSTE